MTRIAKALGLRAFYDKNRHARGVAAREVSANLVFQILQEHNQMLDQAHVMAFVVTVITAVLAVMLHYESFILFGRIVGKSGLSHRRRMLLLIFGLLIVHIVAIWGFGLSAWWLVEANGVGVLTGYETLSLLDYIFMSAVTYTTLGYGDLIPLGPIRFMYGTEALVGFVLITWSASFAFLEMQRNWSKHD